MHVETGKTISEEEYKAITSEKEKEKYKRLPENVTNDTMEKLQRDMATNERLAAIKSLNRKKNKAARKMRQKQRRRK